MGGKEKLNKRLNKSGQIADTLTWMVAFVIIFFIIILFLAATSYLSNARSTSSLELANYSFGGHALSMELSAFVNSANGEWTVYDYLASDGFDKEIFGEYAGNYFGKKNECYVFCFYSENNEKIFSYWNDACGKPASSEWRGFTAISKPADFCESPKEKTMVVASKISQENVYLFKGVKE